MPPSTSSVRMDTKRPNPTVPDSSKEELVKLKATWSRYTPLGPTAETKEDPLLEDTFLSRLKTLILTPNNLDYVSTLGKMTKNWDSKTYSSVIDAIEIGFKEWNWQSFVDLGIFSVSPLDTYRHF